MPHLKKEIILRRIIPTVVIVFITMLLFGPFVFKGYIPIPANYMMSWYEPWKTETSAGGVSTIVHKPVVDDAFRHLYPLRVLATAIIRQGEWPLWNSYNASGTPLLAIMHPGYLTPFGIFFLLMPPGIAWGWYIMLQIVVLGLSVYWYAHMLTSSARASLLSAITMMLSGFAVVRIEYGEFLYVLSGLPLLLGIVELQKAVPLHRGVYSIPLIVLIMMVSGQPHMIVYTLAVFALYTLIRLPIRCVIRFGLLAILGVGLSAVQLIPSLELYLLSTITRETSSFIFERFLLPITHLVTIIIPNYFGNQATYNYFGPHDYVETIAYIGTIPVFLAGVAMWRRWKDVPVRFFALLGIVSIATTIDWIGARLFFRLPIPVLSADVPSRIFVLPAFSAAILAGFGLSEWERLTSPQRMRAIVFMTGLLIGIAALTYGVYRMGIPCPSVSVAQCRMVSVRTTAIELIVFGIFVVSGLIMSRVKGFLLVSLFWVPLVLVGGIGLYNGQKFLPFSPPVMISPVVPVVSALQEKSGLNRYTAVGEAYIRTNLMTEYGISGTEYFDPLNIRRYAELVSYVNHGDKEVGITRSDIAVTSDATVSAELHLRRERFWDLTATTVKLTKKSDALTGDVRLWEDAQWQITARPMALPRLYLVSHVVAPGGDEQILSGLFSSGTDIRKTAFIEDPSGSMPGYPEPAGDADIETYEANRVIITVRANKPAFLVLSDTYYPGWQARIDGEDARIYRANYTFRGVKVPQGTHTLEFRYEPMSLRIGIWIAVVSATVWFGLMWWNGRKRE